MSSPGASSSSSSSGYSSAPDTAASSASSNNESVVLQDMSAENEPTALEAQVLYHLQFKYAGTLHQITVNAGDCIFDLKAVVYSITSVPPERQKLLQLVSGRLPADDLPISQIVSDMSVVLSIHH